MYAAVAEQADAQDLKSCGTYTPVPVRFRSAAYLFKTKYVGVAQLDRAFGYGPKGRGFESSHPRLKQLSKRLFFCYLNYFIYHTFFCIKRHLDFKRQVG